LDANEYRDLINRHISTCKYLEINPHFPSPMQIPEDNPSAFYWHDEILLRDNYRLVIKESAVFEDGEMSERSFYYDFRKKDDRKLVWRICNHFVEKPVSAPCHVHVNPEKEKDFNEFFPDSVKTTFPYAMHCVKNFYEGKPQEWEVS